MIYKGLFPIIFNMSLNLIKALQEELLDSKSSLPSVLRKAKVLASILKNDEMKSWVDNELNGYDNINQVPDYRRIHVEYLGNFHDGYRLFNAYPIPITTLKKYHKNIDDISTLTQGVRSLESLLESDQNKFEMPFPPELFPLLTNEIRGYTCMNAWESSDRVQIEQVLDSVRNRLLNFIIELKEKYPDIDKSEDVLSSIPKEATIQIFNKCIIGNDGVAISDSNVSQEGQVNQLSQNSGDTATNISAPALNDVSHENTGDIHYGNTINNQIITDNSTYAVDKIDTTRLEKASITIINKYGEKNPKIVGMISIIAGLITIFGYIFTIISKSSPSLSWVNDIIPSIPTDHSVIIIAVGLILIFVGGLLLSIVNYKYESRCPACERFYAIKEVGNPTQREVDINGKVRRTTTRTYECKHADCDYQETKNINKILQHTIR